MGSCSEDVKLLVVISFDHHNTIIIIIIYDSVKLSTYSHLCPDFIIFTNHKEFLGSYCAWFCNISFRRKSSTFFAAPGLRHLTIKWLIFSIIMVC